MEPGLATARNTQYVGHYARPERKDVPNATHTILSSIRVQPDGAIIGGHCPDLFATQTSSTPVIIRGFAMWTTSVQGSGVSLDFRRNHNIEYRPHPAKLLGIDTHQTTQRARVCNLVGITF
ncbi:hypothetical protein GJ744_010559 [Endocarpon pusillum]|uniref:Uncharacterized protein n=1 Tax=Endocarpon pusillum TaxID=364733 RepID=A0A8H7E9G2_9EURO|nr:hypothetical protein GJ744_010559 [Endocarpon pusillum]